MIKPTREELLECWITLFKTKENCNMSNDFKESLQCFGWCLIIFGSVLLVEVLVS